MKILFICTTESQVINAINIRKKMYSHKSCDVLCTTERLSGTVNFEKLKMFFNKVYLIDSLHTKDLIKKILFRQDSFLVYKILKGLYNIETYLERKLEGNKGIINQVYSDIFIYSIDNRQCRRYAKFFSEKDGSVVHLFDEGVGTYFGPDPSRRGFFESEKDAEIKIQDIYLYEPNLALKNNICNKFVRIPKFEDQDKELIQKISDVFSWEGVGKYKNESIFFDQPIGNPYYKKRGGLLKLKSKILVNNRRSIQEDKEVTLYNKKVEVIDWLRRKNPELIIKLHPNTVWLKEEYSKKNFNVMENSKIPWEIFYLNTEFNNATWIGINSSAILINYLISNKKNENIKVIFLYKLFWDDNQTDRKIDAFLSKVRKSYKNIYVPENMQQLDAILIAADRK